MWKVSCLICGGIVSKSGKLLIAESDPSIREALADYLMTLLKEVAL